MYPKVSVIIPTYNCSAYIKAAINSALQQSYNNLEIIVVDDGSTDNTQKILTPYIENKKIIYIYQPHSGLSSARNYGVNIATGEYIAFLDADDIWMKNKINKQLKVISDAEVDMVFSNFNNLFENGSILKNRIGEKIKSDNEITFKKLFNNNNIIYPSTVLIKRSVFYKYNVFFDTTLTAIEDYDMWLRLSRAGVKIIGLTEPLVFIRIHISNMSKDIKNMLINELKVISKHRDIVSWRMFQRRKAKIYMLNADRCIHKSEYLEGMKLFFHGFTTYPFLFPDTIIFIAKFIMGKSIINQLRLKLEGSYLNKIYQFFYKRY